LFFKKNSVGFAVGLLKAESDFFVGPSRQILADVIGTNRQLTVAAVDQCGELNPGRPAERTDCIHRRPHGSSGKKHIIDNHDGLAFERQRQLRLPHDGQLRARADIVPVHRHVNHAGGDIDLFYRADELGDSLGNLNPARWNSR